MVNQHPITPPPELIEQWWNTMPGSTTKCLTKLATQAAQWGADQRLEACIGWLALNGYGEAAGRLRPPSLKERIAEAITHGDELTALSLLNEALPND